MKIIWKIKEIRKKKGISQRELAIRSGISKTNVGEIEVGVVKSPAFTTIVKFAKVLNVGITELYDVID